MPIHLENRDIISKVEGLSSALIVACNMCAGASLAMEENKPFIQYFKSFLKSPPLERYISKLIAQLNEKGVKSKKFKAGVIQQFFLCLWTSKQRHKFYKCAKQYDAVIVLGCESAFTTARDSIKGTDCRVIEGMKVAGIMNTKTRFHLPCNISFEESKIIPMCDRHCPRFSRESLHKEVNILENSAHASAKKTAVVD